MSTHQETFYEPDYQLPPPPKGTARLIGIGLALFVLLNLVAIGYVASYQIQHRDVIYPGVSVWGIDLGGMTKDQAKFVLEGQFTYPTDVDITFVDDATGEDWFITSEELGVRFDVDRTVDAAFNVGRGQILVSSIRQQMWSRRRGVEISPVINYNQIMAEAYVNEIAGEVNRPARDATVDVDKQAFTAAANPSQTGRTVDVGATVAALQAQIVTLESGSIPLVVEEIQPTIADAKAAAETISTVLSAPLEVYIDDPAPGDPGPWEADRDALADMIVLGRTSAADGGETYSVRLNEEQLSIFLEPLVTELGRQPKNARYDFDEDSNAMTLQEASVRGRQLNKGSTIQLLNQMIQEGEHRIPLVFDYETPEYTSDMSGEELGIIGLVSSSSTYFAGSSDSRKANVTEAASRFDGVIVKPGEQFSFNHFLGDVSLESGFEEALIIYNGRTITGVGGGVCQVSTTAFQAAFFAGFPITERVPHGYRVGYYETGEGVGLDATVFSPIVDMKFLNDSPGHLLITTDVDLNNSTVTFKFFGTPDGRTVQKDGPYIDNVQAHGPAVYEANPELAPGEVKQVDYAVDGADVTVNRTVYKDGEILFQDTFYSSYIPWEAIYQVAPGSPELQSGG